VVVHKGQLVVDLIDAAHKEIEWRGVAKEKLGDNRGKLVDRVNTAVEKMFKTYPVGIAR
jgi:glutathionylspermidine synthase